MLLAGPHLMLDPIFHLLPPRSPGLGQVANCLASPRRSPSPHSSPPPRCSRGGRQGAGPPGARGQGRW